MNVRAMGALGIVYVVWGSTYLAIRYAIEELPPLLSAAIRFRRGAAHCSATWRCARPGALRATRAQPAPRRCPASCCSPAATGWSRVAEQRVDSGLAALLIACMPLWIVVLRALLRDRPGPATALGVLIGLGRGGADLPARRLRRHRPRGTRRSACWPRCPGRSARCWSRVRPVPADPLTLTTVEMVAGGAVLLVAAGAARRVGRVLGRRGGRGGPGSRWRTWSSSARWSPSPRTSGCSATRRSRSSPPTPT